MRTTNKWVVAVVVALGPTMALMDSTIVTAMLTPMQNAFHTDFDTITWVITAYALAQAAVIPVIGYLSDRLGTKLVFLTALALFTASSLLCGLAPTKELLIVFRVLQAIGGGVLVPISLAIVFRIFPPNEHILASAIMSVPIMLAPAFGPIIGGYLSTNFGWSAVFFINVPLGIIALLLSFLVLPGQSKQVETAEKSFSISGLLLSITGVTTMRTTNKWIVAVVVALGPTMALMDSTIVTVMLTPMQNAFHTDFDTITWVITAYALAQAAVIPVIGYLSDRLGTKLVFLTALALFTASSLLCGLAPTKELLIVFRVLQAIGGGALVPISLAIVFRIFPPNEQSLASAIMTVPIMLAPTFGPTIGGYLSTNFGWSAVFLINVPLGIIALLLSFLVLPGQSKQVETAKKSFSISGLLLSIISVTTLIYGISQASSKGWSDATVLSYFLIGAAVLIVFIIVELQASDPILDLRLFKNYTFTISNFLMWLSPGVYTGSVFLLPLFFEKVQGNSALITGEFLISPGLATGVGVIIAGPLYNRLGPRILTVLGLLLLVVGTYKMILLDVNTTGQELQVWLILRALGMGFVFQTTQTFAFSVINREGMARASSLISVTRLAATAAAVAVLTTYLTLQTATHAANNSNALQVGLQTGNLTGIAAICTQAAGSARNLATIDACMGQHALTTGITDAYWLVLILSAVCIPLALVMGRNPALAALKQTNVPIEVPHTTPNPQRRFSPGATLPRSRMPRVVRLVPLDTD